MIVCALFILTMVSWAQASSPEKEGEKDYPHHLYQVDKRSDNFGLYYEKKELDADNVKYILSLLAQNPNVSKVHYNKDEAACNLPTEIGQDDHYRLKAYFLCSAKNFLGKDLKITSCNKTNLGQGQVTFITNFQILNVPLESKNIYGLTLTVEDLRYVLQSDTRDGMLKIDHKSVDYSPPAEVALPKKKESSFSRMTSAIASYFPSPTTARKNSRGASPSFSKDNKKGEKEASQPPRKSQSFRLPTKAKSPGKSFSPILKKKTPPTVCKDQNRKRSQTSPQEGDEEKVKKSARRSQSFRLPTKERKMDISISPATKSKQNHWLGGRRGQKNKSPILELHKPLKNGFSIPVRKAIDPCDVSKTIQYFEKLHQNAQKE